MTTTNIGPCDCCGSGCCANLPNTLMATITATGDCSCWAGSVELNHYAVEGGDGWESSKNTCGFPGGIRIECSFGAWTLIYNYQSDEPSFGAGCIFGTVLPNAISNVTCSPFYAEISAGILSYLGGDCCSGTVKIIITE